MIQGSYHLTLWCANSVVSRAWGREITAADCAEGSEWHKARAHYDTHGFVGNSAQRAMTNARALGWMIGHTDALCPACADDKRKGRKFAPPAPEGTDGK